MSHITKSTIKTILKHCFSSVIILTIGGSIVIANIPTPSPPKPAASPTPSTPNPAASPTPSTPKPAASTRLSPPKPAASPTPSTPNPAPIQIEPKNIKFTYTGKEQIRIHASGPSVSQKSPVVAWFNSPNEKPNLGSFFSGYGPYLVTDEKGDPIQDPMQLRKLQDGEIREGKFIIKRGQLITLYIPTTKSFSSGQRVSFLITVGANIKELIIKDGVDWTQSIYDKHERFSTYFKAIY